MYKDWITPEVIHIYLFFIVNKRKKVDNFSESKPYNASHQKHTKRKAIIICNFSPSPHILSFSLTQHINNA